MAVTYLQPPEDITTTRDPHHGGNVEWCLYLGTYWSRQVGTRRWVKASRIHPTPKRINTLAILPAKRS